MTAHKHLKQRIRARMEKTGERYATARRHVIRTAEPVETDPATRWHMPGNLPATTALRILLAQAGVAAPHTGAPFSEAMVFGIAGGIGIGVFAFYYAREEHASFYIAGRHQWHDDLAYLRDALARFGMTAVERETAGMPTAERQLHELLEQYGLCIAWVDMAALPHRAMPQAWSGAGYHVITVYRVERVDDTALIGDLTDDPIRIPLVDLAQARARIGKQRNRLLSAVPPEEPLKLERRDLERLVRAGLERCHHGLLHPTLPGAPGNARLDALRTWAERIHGSAAKESWERTFRPGPNLWRGLCAIYDFIEHYGTGGGLCRPLFADFLGEAAGALGQPRLAALAEQYAALGRGWSDLADAALPSDVPLLGEAKALSIRKAELLHNGASTDEVGGIWQRLGELEQQAGVQFPLSDAACAELRAQLRARILALHEGEVAAHAAILQAIA